MALLEVLKAGNPVLRQPYVFVLDADFYRILRILLGKHQEINGTIANLQRFAHINLRILHNNFIFVHFQHLPCEQAKIARHKALSGQSVLFSENCVNAAKMTVWLC